MTILFLGDSLIEYHDWQEELPEHRVANLGVAGESVQGLLCRVVKIKDAFPAADMLFLMSGINNVAMGDLEFIPFYDMILEKLEIFYPLAGIFVHSLLPAAVEFIPADAVRHINTSLRRLAEKRGVRYVDIHRRFVDSTGSVIREYLSLDGVHLSRAGYEIWAALIGSIVKGSSF
ncbi:MAG: hypothetical protein JSU90_02865 [Nitrospiraceae bacterium]|nr:MAG: hypothetical protein JSU90_02865 [Nitrospiraceae bacterium]